MPAPSLRSNEFARLKAAFQKKLNEFCRERGSIARICRECNINRQQFNKYLSGHSLPSMYTLHTIANTLGVDIAEFFVPPEKNRARLRSPVELLSGVKQPATYLLTSGYYIEYTEASEVEGTLIKSISRLWIDRGVMHYKRKMPVIPRYRSNIKMWTYDGFAYESTNSSLIYYVNSSLNENFGAYLLRKGSITGRHLIGLKLAVSGLLTYEPCATVTYFEYIGESPNLRAEMRKCGVLTVDQQSESDRNICKLLSDVSETRGTVIMTRR